MSLNKVLVKSKEPHRKHCVGKRFNSQFETPIYIKFFKSSGSTGKPRNVKSYGHLKWPSLSRLILRVKGHGSMSRRLPHPLLRETYSSYLTCNSHWFNVSYGSLKMLHATNNTCLEIFFPRKQNGRGSLFPATTVKLELSLRFFLNVT